MFTRLLLSSVALLTLNFPVHADPPKIVGYLCEQQSDNNQYAVVAVQPNEKLITIFDVTKARLATDDRLNENDHPHIYTLKNFRFNKREGVDAYGVMRMENVLVVAVWPGGYLNAGDLNVSRPGSPLSHTHAWIMKANKPYGCSVEQNDFASD